VKETKRSDGEKQIAAIGQGISRSMENCEQMEKRKYLEQKTWKSSKKIREILNFSHVERKRM
jgi:hypothetical protein